MDKQLEWQITISLLTFTQKFEDLSCSNCWVSFFLNNVDRGQKNIKPIWFCYKKWPKIFTKNFWNKNGNWMAVLLTVRVRNSYFVSDVVGNSVYPSGNLLLSKIPFSKMSLASYRTASKNMLLAEFFLNDRKLKFGGVHFKAGSAWNSSWSG